MKESGSRSCTIRSPESVPSVVRAIPTEELAVDRPDGLRVLPIHQHVPVQNRGSDVTDQKLKKETIWGDPAEFGKMERTNHVPTLLILLGLALVVLKIAKFSAALLVYVIATAMVVYHECRSITIAKLLLAHHPQASGCAAVRKSARARQRLMARSLHHAMCLTELQSLLPTVGARGSAIAQAMMTRAT